MTEATFRRYTNLAAAIHLLRSGHLTLLSPATWDDRNDAYFMAEYKRQKGAASVLALCFAEQIETYHHWRIFAPGMDGVCIEFDKLSLLARLDQDHRVRHRAVEYVTLEEVSRTASVQVERLPFMKRYPYGHEGEYRVLFVDQTESHPSFDFEINLSWINHITLSPWMPPVLAESVRHTLKAIPQINIPMHQSTLINNEDWKAFARRAVGAAL